MSAYRTKWLTYKGVKIRIQKNGPYSIVELPTYLILIRPRDENNQLINLATKLRKAKKYIDDMRPDQLTIERNI